MPAALGNFSQEAVDKPVKTVTAGEDPLSLGRRLLAQMFGKEVLDELPALGAYEPRAAVPVAFDHAEFDFHARLLQRLVSTSLCASGTTSSLSPCMMRKGAESLST